MSSCFKTTHHRFKILQKTESIVEDYQTEKTDTEKKLDSIKEFEKEVI